ncbi:unnamed protein product [Protopolystoma xenopodis]|uniref:Uncharacterized protein n=1 Tax=Protopolystoma xenopodis TaxID=117903 RepID=A0A448WHJ0_9PLAT|nr:unnamed protein product [Protopolystoma xenopodis]
MASSLLPIAVPSTRMPSPEIRLSANRPDWRQDRMRASSAGQEHLPLGPEARDQSTWREGIRSGDHNLRPVQAALHESSERLAKLRRENARLSLETARLQQKLTVRRHRLENVVSGSRSGKGFEGIKEAGELCCFHDSAWLKGFCSGSILGSLTK